MAQAGDIVRLDRGSYQLRSILSSSSYGVVWDAGDAAIKLVNSEQMARARPDQQSCWIDSARTEIAFLEALSPWDGRHIVRLVDSGEYGGLPAMALEKMQGDLARHVSTARSLPFQRVLAWMAQVNQALAKVHQYGWRYLDLKPANLLLDASTNALKLADFGTSRALADLEPHGYAGTANWQAPEQFFPDTDHLYSTCSQTDYFALGALFYYLVTKGEQLAYCKECGEAYRDHRTGGAYLVKERHGRALPPTLTADESERFVARLPRASAGPALTLLRQLLAPAPAGRPASALDISRALAHMPVQVAA
jgi:serine/threonine protein kinase